MSKKALVPLGLIAAAGVMGSLANGQGNKRASTRRGMGRRGVKYDSAANEAWVAFFSADTPTPEGMRLGRKFRDRIEYLVDNKFNLPDDAEYPDLDDLAYLSYASHAGHGVGLWEDRAPWHSSFEKVVMADKQARDLGYRLDEEIYEGTAGVMFSRGNGQGNKRGKAQRRYHVRYWDETDKDEVREVLLRTDKEAAAWAKVNELEEDQMDYEGIEVFDTARQEVIWESPPKGPTIRDPWARLGGFAARGRQAKTNYRREDRKSASEGRRAKHSKRDFVKQVWERQAPTMTGGPLPPPIPGMEGPFRFRNGMVLYWDPKEGKYYDRGRDLYVTSGRR